MRMYARGGAPAAAHCPECTSSGADVAEVGEPEPGKVDLCCRCNQCGFHWHERATVIQLSLEPERKG